MNDPRSERAVSRQALAFVPLGMVVLKIPCGNIVCDGVAEDMLLGLLLRNVRTFADYNG